MIMSGPDEQTEKKEEKLIEGLDFYFENGLFVLTEHFLHKRGYCCKNGCRHCPYGFRKSAANETE